MRAFQCFRPPTISTYEARLKARGFTQSDMDALRTYVAEHDLTLAIQAAATRIAEKYAKYFADDRTAGRPLNVAAVTDYHYEIRRSWRETERKWSLDLLDALDNQRQRILASFFEEVASAKNFGKAQKNAQLVSCLLPGVPRLNRSSRLSSSTSLRRAPRTV